MRNSLNLRRQFSIIMADSVSSQVQNFTVVGISYRKASLDIREKFALSASQQEHIYHEAALNGIESLCIISTCNRTEIYSYSKSPEFVIYLMLKFSKACMDDFSECGYILRGNEAVKYIFKVAAGLDSQILGDSQIICQIRASFAAAEQRGSLNGYMKRLLNNVNQASKKIKTETDLCSGSASVSFTAVQYILKNISKDKLDIVLVGAGKMGELTCANLLKHVSGVSLTLINRDPCKAERLASKLQLKYAPIEDLEQLCHSADVIVVATGAPSPTLLPWHLGGSTGKKLVLDLSVPRNADPAIAEINGVTLVGVDELSQENEEVLHKRRQAIPDAELLIYDQISDFYDWLSIQHLSPTFKTIKESLHDIRQKELDYHKNRLAQSDKDLVELISKNIVNKVARKCINYLKTNHQKTDTPKDIIEGIFMN
jgi:glutamyl-tRNA reductase